MTDRIETCREPLRQYLHSWGLQDFTDEAAYYEWQKTSLSGEELRTLQALLARRQGSQDSEADRQFYDFLTRPNVLPVVYSQRFQYFLTLGQELIQRISPATDVLDVGCGVGILTLFLAQRFPDVMFCGIDRSSASIIRAQGEAKSRGIGNVRFEQYDLDLGQSPSYEKSFDVILSCQAIFQAEHEPGLPSDGWNTFKRSVDSSRQALHESRTGLQGRLDALVQALRPQGRMMFFEKTLHLGRRVVFQRALANRHLFQLSPPVPCSVGAFQEQELDGPLYEVGMDHTPHQIPWKEEPLQSPGDTLYRCVGIPARRIGELLEEQSFEKVTRSFPRGESVTLRFGEWHQALVGVVCETTGGFLGAVVGGRVERSLLLQMLEKVKGLNEEEVSDMVEYFWGSSPGSPERELEPCYECHHPFAQHIFFDLPSKHIERQHTFEEGEGRQCHLELGSTLSLGYVYWANTFDQRQLVIMDQSRARLLEEYYEESLLQVRPSIAKP